MLGFFLGVLPGGGAVVSTFAVLRDREDACRRNPEKFGKGAIEGVAGPEAANNAAAGGAFIPLMTLGIPPNVVMALLLGAFIIHGLQPGPLMIAQNPKLFWGIIASMYIGNLMLLVLNLPLIGMWVKLLKLPYNVLFPLILLFTIIGVYASGNNVFDIYVMIFFGIMGYFMRKFGFEPAPLVLAFVLGPLLENNLRKALILSQGDLVTFLQRPISATCLVIAVAMLLSPLLPTPSARSARWWRWIPRRPDFQLMERLCAKAGGCAGLFVRHALTASNLSAMQGSMPLASRGWSCYVLYERNGQGDPAFGECELPGGTGCSISICFGCS